MIRLMDSTHRHSIHTHTHTHTSGFNLDIPIFTKLYEFYKCFSDYLIRFPKTKRYTLGQKIDQITLEIIELTITAGYLPREQKLVHLKTISVKLDLLKLLVRLAWETKCLTHVAYQQSSVQLVEIGKMLGGWIRACLGT